MHPCHLYTTNARWHWESSTFLRSGNLPPFWYNTVSTQEIKTLVNLKKREGKKEHFSAIRAKHSVVLKGIYMPETFNSSLKPEE